MIPPTVPSIFQSSQTSTYLQSIDVQQNGTHRNRFHDDEYCHVLKVKVTVKFKAPEPSNITNYSYNVFYDTAERPESGVLRLSRSFEGPQGEIVTLKMRQVTFLSSTDNSIRLRIADGLVRLMDHNERQSRVKLQYMN